MRFLALFLGVVAVLAGLYAGAVRLVDPHGDFGTGLFPVVNLDARAEKMRLFRAYAAGPAAPEGLILGSSRAMKLSPVSLEAETGRRFFNFAVDMARAEDYLAIYRWVRAQGTAIRYLVIGLDVEALHSDDRPDPGLQRNDALMRALGPTDLPAPGLRRPHGFVRPIKEYKATFTSQYTGDLLRSVRFFLRPQSRPLPLMEFEPDGYLRYRRWESERAAGTFRFDRDMERCLTKSLTRLDEMTGLSRRRRGYLRDLVDEARRDGVRVVLWITSLHPLTERYLEAHTSYASLLEATREYEQRLARDEGVATYDFSRPANYDGSDTGFYDCDHIDESNASRVVAALGLERR